MTDDSPLTGSERAELEALRAEVARQRAELGETSSPREHPSGPSRARWPLAVTLSVLAGVVAIAAVAAGFVRSQLFDTDRYVETVAPLATDPAVQTAVATRVGDIVVERLDLEKVVVQAFTQLSDAAPRVSDTLVALAPLIADQADGAIRRAVDSFVRSEAFDKLWTSANTVAHSALVAVLTGGNESTALVTDDRGQVSVQLGPIVDAVQKQLEARGVAFAASIPDVDASFVVFSAPRIGKLQAAARTLDRVATVLPWAALALAAGAVATAPRGRRRSAVVVSASAIAGGMLLLALGIAIGRGVYLSEIRAQSPQAAAAVFDAVVEPLRTTLRYVAVVALVVAFAAWLSGPGRAPEATRRGVLELVSRASGGRVGDVTREPSRVQAWVGAHAVALTVALVALGGLVLVFWRYPTGAVALWVSVVVVVLVAAVWILAAPARRAADASPAPADR